jgi:hypothetical protein
VEKVSSKIKDEITITMRTKIGRHLTDHCGEFRATVDRQTNAVGQMACWSK